VDNSHEPGQSNISSIFKSGGILKMTGTIKKSVKISDDGFLKSTKDFFSLKKIDYAEELKFLIPEEQPEQDRMRLADLRSHLGNQSIF